MTDWVKDETTSPTLFVMNGSLCRVRDTRKAAQDNRGSWGHTGQVALASQPLLQQSSHLWRLHHHQSMGHHSCPLCTQVRLLALPALKVWCYRLHRRELSVINSCTTLDTLAVLSSHMPPLFFLSKMSATGYLRYPAGWSMLVLSPAAQLKWHNTQDTPWRRSSTTRTTITGAMIMI